MSKAAQPSGQLQRSTDHPALEAEVGAFRQAHHLQFLFPRQARETAELLRGGDAWTALS